MNKIKNSGLIILLLVFNNSLYADSDVDSFIIEIETLMDQGYEIRDQYNFENRVDKQRCDNEKSQLKSQGRDLLNRINEASAAIPADLKQAAHNLQSCITCSSSKSSCDRTRALLERVKQGQF